MGVVVKLAVGTSRRDVSKSKSTGQVTEGGTRSKEEAKPGGCHQKGQIIRRGLGEEAVETEGRWLGDGIRFRINGDQVGTGCLFSRRNGCLSKVEHRCRLALNGTELALSFNFFFH